MKAVPVVKRISAARKPRGQFHHGNLAEAALAVATEEIDRHGHLELSLRAVADRLGVSQPALYRHFTSKDALLDEIGLRGFARFADAIAPAPATKAVPTAEPTSRVRSPSDPAAATSNDAPAAASSDSDPFATLEQLGRAYVRFAHANPGWFRMWFARVNNERTHAPEHAAFVARLMPLGMRVRTRLRGVMVDIVGEDVPIVDDLYRVVWALSHGLAVFVVERVFQLVQTDEERIAAADAAIALHVEALRARWPRRPA